jgi:hypothetical protein
MAHKFLVYDQISDNMLGKSPKKKFLLEKNEMKKRELSIQKEKLANYERASD